MHRPSFAAVLWFVLALGFAILRPVAAEAQERPDIIRGQVLGPDSLPQQAARITVVSLVNQAQRTTTTNDEGRYTVIFPGGGGDYLVTIQIIGMQPVQQQLRRELDEDLLVLDVVMQPIRLETVITIADRERPGRGEGLPDPTGSERSVAEGAAPLSAMGDLSALVASLPGVTLLTGPDGTPIGFSVFGLGADQNTITMNGVEVDASDLPADVLADARLTTTTFDPSRGGFSGANVSFRTRRGSRMVQRYASLTVDEPNLQWIDRTGAQLGREYTQLRLQGAASGPLVPQKLFYSTNLQLYRRTRDLNTLLNTPMGALEQLGASPDSVARLRDVAGAQGIPLGVAGLPDAVTTTTASVVGRLDLTPEGQHALNANFNLNWRGNDATNMSALALPSNGGEDSRVSGTFQMQHSTYFGEGILTTTRGSISMNRSEAAPYVDLPDARIRVMSGYTDERPGIATFRVGGNSGMERESSGTSWQLGNEISWISTNNAHRLRLESEIEGEGYDQVQAGNRLGTFEFNSLEDFEQGLPSEFSRQLTATRRDGSMLRGWASLGDSWRRTRNLQFQYGVRFEWNRFGIRPDRNPLLEQSLGIRNDFVPNEVALSPRFGFSWRYGTEVQVEAFRGAQRGSRATLRGGIGLFRRAPRAELVQSAISATGLPSAVQTLNCRGEAVPTPEWDLWVSDPSTVPDECADGSIGTVFADRQPSVTLFDPDYRSPRSWRANLAWSGSLGTRFRASLEGTYSLNLAQSSTIDLNFRNEQQFTLDDEGGRPVYVAPTSIAENTGAIASRDARVDTAFSRVNARVSDLRSRTAAFEVSLSPLARTRRWFSWRAGYHFTHSAELDRGFGGSTAGDPLVREWSRGRSAPHQFNGNVSFRFKGITLGLSGRLSSGIRYTPMVSGDINGDGSGNDRAFIFDPDQASDPAVATAMRDLLADAPDGARECLLRQMGSVAARSSCTGPWSLNTNLSLRMNPLQFRLPRRTSVSLDFSNPLTGLDLLVNGSDNLRGWGESQTNPEATLLYVRGFDPVTQRFQYEVNPRFGDTRSSRARSRSPFLVTVAFRMDLGPEPAKQNLERELDQWESGERRRPTMAQLRVRYVAQFAQPFAQLMRQRDSLGLTPEQTDSLTALQARFVGALDTLWTPIAEHVAALDEGYDIDDIYGRMKTAQRRSAELQLDHGQAVRALLTDEQVRRVPERIAMYFDSRQLTEMHRAMGYR